MASEMLESVLAEEKKSADAIAQATSRAQEIIAQAHADAAKAKEECRALCSANSAAAAEKTAEKCKEAARHGESKDSAAQREMLAKISGERAAAVRIVKSMILKSQ